MDQSKIRDSTPLICPAGLVKKQERSVKECLEIYPTDDAIEMILHKAGLRKVDLEYKRQRMVNTRHRGAFELTKKILCPPVETRYQTLLKDLKETIYESYWNKELGRIRDVAGKLPVNLDLETTTFGKITHKDSIKDILNPSRTISEINSETAQYHEMYKKTHKDYYPGEQISYNYDNPSFKPDQRFGKPRTYDPKFAPVQCLIKNINLEPITSTNFIQADYLTRTHFQLGKSLTPNNNILSVPPQHSFGKKSERPLYGVEELIKPDNQVSPTKKAFLNSLKYINELRYYFKKHEIDLSELIEICLENDTEKCECIHVEMMKDIFCRNQINLNYDYLLGFAEILGLYQNNVIKYHDFINLFDIKKKLPDLPTKFDDFNHKPCYITSYQAAGFGSLKNSCGMKSTYANHKLPSSTVLKVDQIHLGQETNAECLINPSIYSNYGLTQYDFWEPRKPEYIKKLFEHIGFEFPNDTFNELWEIGLKIDNTGLVCIDTFKNLLYKTAPLEMKTQSPKICN